MDKNINMSAICFLLFFIIGYLNGANDDLSNTNKISIEWFGNVNTNNKDGNQNAKISLKTEKSTEYDKEGLKADNFFTILGGVYGSSKNGAKKNATISLKNEKSTEYGVGGSSINRVSTSVEGGYTADNKDQKAKLGFKSEAGSSNTTGFNISKWFRRSVEGGFTADNKGQKAKLGFNAETRGNTTIGDGRSSIDKNFDASIYASLSGKTEGQKAKLGVKAEGGSSMTTESSNNAGRVEQSWFGRVLGVLTATNTATGEKTDASIGAAIQADKTMKRKQPDTVPSYPDRKSRYDTCLTDFKNANLLKEDEEHKFKDNENWEDNLKKVNLDKDLTGNLKGLTNLMQDKDNSVSPSEYCERMTLPEPIIKKQKALQEE